VGIAFNVHLMKGNNVAQETHSKVQEIPRNIVTTSVAISMIVDVYDLT